MGRPEVTNRQWDTVLILEQDTKIADLLAANLEDAGWPDGYDKELKHPRQFA
jgi:hypothetical protein